MKSVNTDIITEYLKIGKDGFLCHRESRSLEYKEQFHLSDIKAYVKDFAGFANNSGGYMIFGVKDSPRELVGMNEKSRKQFKSLDPRYISDELLNDFSPDIDWGQSEIEIKGKIFGIFVIQESNYKPIIAKRNTEKITEGEVYYRYSGQTTKIKFPELNSIVEDRIERNNEQWLKRVSEIGKSGPTNSAVLSTSERFVKNGKETLVIDEKLIKEIEFIREGHFVEKYGTRTLKLVGEIIPARTFKIKTDLVKEYPYSATELAKLIKMQEPLISTNDIWKCINKNKLKYDERYSSFVFPNNSQLEEYLITKEHRKGTPSIYNDKARVFILNELKRRTNGRF